MINEAFSYDVAHMLAGGMLLVSFMLLYQDRMYGLLNVFALHAFVLSLSVAWEAYVNQSPHLYITAAIALVLKAIIIPTALHRIVQRLGIHRTVETTVGIGSQTIIDRTSATTLTDGGSVPVPPDYFYKVLPADECGEPVFP